MIVCLLVTFSEGVWKVPCTAKVLQKQFLVKPPLDSICDWYGLKVWPGFSTNTLQAQLLNQANKLCFLHPEPAHFSPACHYFQTSASLILLESSMYFKSSFLSARGKYVRNALESMSVFTLSLTPLCCWRGKKSSSSCKFCGAIAVTQWVVESRRDVAASQMTWACSPVPSSDLSAAPSI